MTYNQLGASGDSLDDESLSSDSPRTTRTKPEDKILRELAKAGLSKRGLVVASDRWTARRIRVGLARAEWLHQLRLRMTRVGAKALSAVRKMGPRLVIGGIVAVGIFVLVHLIGGSLLLAIALAVGGDIITLVLKYIVPTRRR